MTGNSTMGGCERFSTQLVILFFLMKRQSQKPGYLMDLGGILKVNVFAVGTRWFGDTQTCANKSMYA